MGRDLRSLNLPSLPQKRAPKVSYQLVQIRGTERIEASKLSANIKRIESDSSLQWESDLPYHPLFSNECVNIQSYYSCSFIVSFTREGWKGYKAGIPLAAAQVSVRDAGKVHPPHPPGCSKPPYGGRVKLTSPTSNKTEICLTPELLFKYKLPESQMNKLLYATWYAKWIISFKRTSIGILAVIAFLPYFYCISCISVFSKFSLIVYCF